MKLRGFIPAGELGDLPVEIQVSQLQPIEELIDYLYQLETIIETEKLPNSPIEEIVKNELEAAEESVREKLKDKSIAQIVAQLEHVYRNYDSSNWWDEGVRL